MTKCKLSASSIVVSLILVINLVNSKFGKFLNAT